MELRQYFRLFLRWSWLIVLAALVGGSLAFFQRRNQPNEYKSYATVMIGNVIDTANPNSTDLGVATDLTRSYAELARLRPVLQGTIDALDLDTNPIDLRGAITTALVPETTMLQIIVIYHDPDLAASIANEVANQLILKSPSNLTAEQEATIQSARDSIDQLNGQIAATNRRLTQITQQLDESTDPDELLALQAQYNVNSDLLTSAQAAKAAFQQSISALQQRTNSLTVVEEAIPPPGPRTKGVLQTGILGAIAGIVLSSALVLFISYQESTLKSAEQTTDLLDLPVLGAVMRFGRSRDGYAKRLIVRDAPTSAVAENYSTLRTNLMFSANGQSRREIYVVTSPGPGEGKSVTTANLAVSMALSGMRVLLIDADLRRPSVHDVFNLENRGSLAKLFVSDPEDYDLPSEPLDDWSELPDIVQQSLQTIDIPNMVVMPSGALPQIPAEVLHSEYLADWLKILRTVLDIDVIVFDSPPCLPVADTAILTANVHARVVLVIEAGRTQRSDAIKARDRLRHIGGRIAGVVLNKSNPREQAFGYSSYYTSPSG